MRRNSLSFLATFAAAGVVALSACGGGDMPPPAAGTQQGQGNSAAGGADAAGADVSLLKGTNRSATADRSSGDLAPPTAAPEVKAKWVEVRAAEAGGLEPAVVNGAGRTVYYFADDPVNGKVSNCNGDCAKQWPPVVIGRTGNIMFTGVPKANIGFVKRADGGVQLTIGGRPIYLFAKDTQRGDIKGQGVGGKWFVINPEGKRATPPAEVPAPPPASSKGTPAESVTFFTGRNFDDFSGSNFSTGVKVSSSCTDLRRGFRSLAVEGEVKIWSEPGCKGLSIVVNNDVRDTADLSFPDGVKSFIRP